MTVSNSSKSKPNKPYPEFPLYAMSNGQWGRKIAGKHYSFGKWDDPTAALEKHNREYSFLKEGISPPTSFEGWRVGEVLNEFLSIQEDRVKLREIEQCTFDGLENVAKIIVKSISKRRAVDSLRPNDFRKLRTEIIGTYTPAVARVIMSRTRSFFKFAYDEQLIEKQVFYGRGFASPTKAMVRKARNAKPKKLFTADQVKLLMDDSTPTIRAMILLSINTGMNNADLGNLKHRHIDFNTGWLDYPRHKTGIERVAKLWPETVDAINAYLEDRQRPLNEFSEFLFITLARRKWGHSSLPSEFRKLRERTNAKRNDDGTIKLDGGGVPIPKNPEPIPHGTFGYFRHTFETIAGGSRDQVAVDAIMGHVDDSMAAEYREEIDPERLEAVADHVHAWLFGGAK